MKRRKTVSALILLLAALLMIAGLSSCKDPEPEPLTDEEALRGQWAVYYLEEPGTEEQTSGEPGSADTGTQEKEIFAGNIIDIQYTLPGYWFFGYAPVGTPDDESMPSTLEEITELTEGHFTKSNRVHEEDGWFVISRPTDNPDGPKTKIRYRFTDEERNTMEAEVNVEKPESAPPAGNPDTEENTDTGKCIMRRLNHVIKINMDTMIVGGK